MGTALGSLYFGLEPATEIQFLNVDERPWQGRRAPAAYYRLSADRRGERIAVRLARLRRWFIDGAEAHAPDEGQRPCAAGDRGADEGGGCGDQPHGRQEGAARCRSSLIDNLPSGVHLLRPSPATVCGGGDTRAPDLRRARIRACRRAGLSRCMGCASGQIVRDSDRSVLTRIMDHHPIAIEATAEKLIRRSPQIQAKAPIVEFAEALNDEFAVGIEVARPLLEREKIAVAVVEDLKDVERCPGKLVKKVM